MTGQKSLAVAKKSHDASFNSAVVTHKIPMKHITQYPTKIIKPFRTFPTKRSLLKIRKTVFNSPQVKASVMQGSGLGPTSYLVTAADLQPVTAGNHIFKYADDMHLVIPAVNSNTCLHKVLHIEKWAAENNSSLTVWSLKNLFLPLVRHVRPQFNFPPSAATSRDWRA